MEDLILQLERDSEILDLISELSEREQEMILSEMRETSDRFQSALNILDLYLIDERSVLTFVDTVGEIVSDGALSNNIGTEAIQWPEKH